MLHTGSTHLVSSSYSVLEVKKSIFTLIFTSYNMVINATKKIVRTRAQPRTFPQGPGPGPESQGPGQGQGQGLELQGPGL